MGKHEETYNYDEIKRLLTIAIDKGYSAVYVLSTFSLAKVKLKQLCPMLEREEQKVILERNCAKGCGKF